MKCFSSRLPPSSPSNPFVYYHRPHLLLRPWDLLFSGKEMRVQPKKERGEKTKRCGETGGRKKSNSITSLAPFPSFFRTFFALFSFLPTFFFPPFLLLRSYRQRRPATQKRQGGKRARPPRSFCSFSLFPFHTLRAISAGISRRRRFLAQDLVLLLLLLLAPN